MCDSYRSPSFQSILWCFSCSSIKRQTVHEKSEQICVSQLVVSKDPLTSRDLNSSIVWISFTGSTCCWRMKSAMAVTDLWPLYSLFIIIPLRNSFSVGYLVMRYRWAMSAAQRKRKGLFKQRRANQLMKRTTGQSKTHGDGWMRSGAVTQTLVKPWTENSGFSQRWALISYIKATPHQE